MNISATQYYGESIIKVLRQGGMAGLLLLLRPVIYFLFSRKRDLSAYSTVDVSAIVFIIYSVICFVVGWRIIVNSKSGIGQKILYHSPISWFVAYTVLGLLSMIWSVNLPLTGFRAFECFAMTLIIIAAVQTLLENGGIKLTLVWTLLFVTFDIFMSIARAYRLSSNIYFLLESSQMMATTYFFMALFVIPRSWYNYLIMIMSVFSMSTVAYIGMAMGTVSAFFSNQKVRIMAIVGGFALVIAIIAIGPRQFLLDTIFFDKADISIEQTSGRDRLMMVALEALENEPMGYGFFAGEPYLLYAKYKGAISAHNSIFSAAIGMGYLGVVLISCFFIAMCMSAFSKSQSSELRSILIGCFIVALLHCMGNPSVGTRVFGAWIPCMYLFVLICGVNIYGRDYEILESEEEINQIEEL